MSWDVSLLVYIALLGVMISIGVPMALAMGLTGIVGLTLLHGTLLWPSLGDVVWNSTNSFTLVAVPLFVLMGEILLKSGAAERFYSGLSILMGRVPGGLAQSNILGSALFSAISGSSTATTLTIGTVAIPQMRKRGYNDHLTFGTLTGGGALGNLIPPSIFLLIYASVVQASAVELFVATVVPGLIAVAMFMAYVAAKAWANPGWVPPRGAPAAPRDIVRALVDCVPISVLILSIIGGMYGGIMTPTEAAGFGCLLAFAVAGMHRRLSIAAIRSACVNSISITCVLSLIIINGQILGFAVTQAGIGVGVSRALVEMGLSPFLFFVFLFVLYLVLGAMLEGVSMMLLTVPVLYPTLKAMGFDDVWFGVFLVIQAELAQLSPPIGLNLIAVQSVARDAKLGLIMKATLPYAIMLSALCFLLYTLPDLALWLPDQMRGR